MFFFNTASLAGIAKYNQILINYEMALAFMVDKNIQSEEFWADAWMRHIDDYLSAPPRSGYWLNARFGQQPSALEIAGGSCRDSRYLSSVWRHCVGVDFDERTVAYLRKKFPDTMHKVLNRNAFSLGFEKAAFDVSFSNGFWILFSEDQQIIELAREQARVTRKWMVVIVHNDLNSNLKANFARKAEQDPLYDIRYFSPHEVERLVRAAGIPFRSISLEKFGGPVDALYRPKLKGLPNPIQKNAHSIVPHLYRFQSWEQTERVACVVDLER